MAASITTPPAIITSTIASGHTIGDNTIAVAAGTGPLFGSSGVATIIQAIAATDQGIVVSPNNTAIFTYSGRSGDTLTGVAIKAGSTDRNFVTGDIITPNLTTAALDAITSAVTNWQEYQLTAVTQNSTIGNLVWTITLPAAIVTGIAGGGGSGTVTSVALTVPAGLAVAGSPISASGTFAVTTALSGILKGTGTGFTTASAGTDYLAPSGNGSALTGITESQVANLTTDLAARSLNLTPTTVKTGPYTAAGNEYVPVDASAASVAITLPTTPANKTRIGIKQIAVSGAFVTTYVCGGSDVINKAGGSASGTLTLSSQGVILQYDSSTSIWYVISADVPLGQTDLRYAKLASPALTGVPTAPTPLTADNSTTIATTAYVKAQAGGGAVSSVAAADSTLTISPTTGSVLAGLNLAQANTWTAAPTVLKAVGVTSADGLVLSNTTAAAVGAQQWSPRVHFVAQGWKTTATAASQQVEWIAELQTIQGTTSPTGSLVFSSNVNSAGFNARTAFASNGQILANGPASNSLPDYSFAGSPTAGIYSRSANLVTIASNGVACMEISGSAGGSITMGFQVQFGNGVGSTNDTSIARTAAGVLNFYKSNSTTTPVSVLLAGAAITPGTVALLTVGAHNTKDNATTVQISSLATGNKGLVVQAFASQTANAIEVQKSDGTVLHAIGPAGKTLTYNGVATAGLGVPAIYGSGRSTAQTAAVASVAAYTNGAADGSFMVSANVNVTASTTHSFTVTVAYTDETNTPQTQTLNFSQLAGTMLTAISNVQGVGPYNGVAVQIRCKASTAITIATTGTFTSVTYNVEGIIKQIA